MATTATGTSSVGTSVLISGADYIIGQWFIAFLPLRASLPRRVGYYYVLITDISSAGNVYVTEHGPLYVPGIFHKLALPPPGSTWKMALVVTWDVGGLVWNCATV